MLNEAIWTWPSHSPTISLIHASNESVSGVLEDHHYGLGPIGGLTPFSSCSQARQRTREPPRLKSTGEGNQSLPDLLSVLAPSLTMNTESLAVTGCVLSQSEKALGNRSVFYLLRFSCMRLSMRNLTDRVSKWVGEWTESWLNFDCNAEHRLPTHTNTFCRNSKMSNTPKCKNPKRLLFILKDSVVIIVLYVIQRTCEFSFGVTVPLCPLSGSAAEWCTAGWDSDQVILISVFDIWRTSPSLSAKTFSLFKCSPRLPVKQEGRLWGIKSLSSPSLLESRSVNKCARQGECLLKRPGDDGRGIQRRSEGLLPRFYFLSLHFTCSLQHELWVTESRVFVLLVPPSSNHLVRVKQKGPLGNIFLSPVWVLKTNHDKINPDLPPTHSHCSSSHDKSCLVLITKYIIFMNMMLSHVKDANLILVFIVEWKSRLCPWYL